MTASGTALRAQRAFLVQLAVDCVPGDVAVAGRVEHIRSGEAGHFAGIDELVAFMWRALGAKDPTRDGDTDR